MALCLYLIVDSITSHHSTENICFSKTPLVDIHRMEDAKSLSQYYNSIGSAKFQTTSSSASNTGRCTSVFQQISRPGQRLLILPAHPSSTSTRYRIKARRRTFSQRWSLPQHSHQTRPPESASNALRTPLRGKDCLRLPDLGFHHESVEAAKVRWRGKTYSMTTRRCIKNPLQPKSWTHLA